MSTVIITGAYSTGNPQYSGLSKWKIKALNSLDDYAEYIGADLFVVDNSTGFQRYVQEIKDICKNLETDQYKISPCNWCLGTLCSVWGVRNLLNKYDQYLWIDLDLITSKKHNLLDIATEDFCIYYNKQSCDDIDSLDIYRRKKTLFCIDFLNQNRSDFVNVSSGVFKMNNDMVDIFDKFCKNNIDSNIQSMVQYFRINHNYETYYKFVCDETIFQAFVNEDKKRATVLDTDKLVLPFYTYGEVKKLQLVKDGTDDFVHFAGQNKKYIPDFIKSCESRSII